MEIKTIPNLFRNLQNLYKNKDFAVYKENKMWKRVSSLEAFDKINAISVGFYELGIRKGDKVCIISESRYEWVIVDFAISILGAISVPIYPTLSVDNIEYIINHSEAKNLIISNNILYNKIKNIKLENIQNYIIFENSIDHSINNSNILTLDGVEENGKKNLNDEYLKIIENLYQNIDEEDLASIIYTSGTTGTPKGVMLSHKNFISNAYGALKKLNLETFDTNLVILPLSHSFARTCNYGLIMGGVKLWFSEKLSTLAKDLQESKTDSILVVPRLFESIYEKLINNANSKGGLYKKIFYWAKNIAETSMKKSQCGQKISFGINLQKKIADKLVYSKIREKTGGKLKLVVSGSSQLPTYISYFFNGIGIPIIEGYGLTEASPVISTNTPDNNKIGTVGTPFHNVEIKQAIDKELLVKGPNIMMGYYKEDKATIEAFTSDGWLKTGDIVEIDSDNFIKIIDRKKDLLKTSGGKFIIPQKIENIAKMNEYIEEFVVIGENRKYPSAIILPNFKKIKEYFEMDNMDNEDTGKLIENPEVYKLFKGIISKQINSKLAEYETIRKFILIAEPFTIEEGTMTPTLKVKRKQVIEKYKNSIDKLYS